MLLVLLGLVIATMRQLDKPSTARRLGQMFGTPEVSKQPPPSHPSVINTAAVADQPESAAALAKAAPPDEGAASRGGSWHSTGGPAETANNPLADVQDNTYFRPAEHEAWFGLFQRIQEMNAQQLAEATLGELTYAQLLQQPQVYRGQVVTVRGTLRREELEHPPENASGIDAYHRLVIQPRGGGNWPLIVYCLELPSGFPRGENLQAPISVTGFYFKNWSYAWQDGLGIAPVVLARSVDWQPADAPQRRESVTRQGLAQAILAAGAFAVLVVYWVVRGTRRQQQANPSAQPLTFPDESAVETIGQRLQRLADAESLE